jgi:ribose 1,5-bisphosphokinase PhnN
MDVWLEEVNAHGSSYRTPSGLHTAITTGKIDVAVRGSFAVCQHTAKKYMPCMLH